MNRNRQSSRSAFATAMAIVLLGLVTTALAALMVVSRSDYQRTTAIITEAQLRQLLLAATMDSSARASNWSDAPKPEQWTVDAAANGGSVRLELGGVRQDQLLVRASASLGARRLVQSLRYERADEKWRLVEVQINSGE